MDVAGLHPEITDPVLFTFKHQLPAFFLDGGALKAGLVEDFINAFAQSSFRESHVDHGFFLGGRCFGLFIRIFQPFQHVQVNREADGAGAAAHFLHQAIVPAAGEDAGGDAFQIALEDDAAVVVHVADDGEIQVHMVREALLFQQFRQAFQFVDGRPHLLVGADGFQLWDHLIHLPVGGDQHGQLFDQLPGQVIVVRQLADVMDVLVADVLDDFFLSFAGDEVIVHDGGDQTHMGDIQDKVRADGFQTLQRQQHHFAHRIRVDGAQAFQPGLHDFPKGIGTFGRPVNAFVIVDPLDLTRHIRCVFHDGKGHVRLQRQKLAVQVVEGDDIFRNQKVLVPHVQVVFFKFTHFKAGVAVLLVQCPQAEHGQFIIPQYFFI